MLVEELVITEDDVDSVELLEELVVTGVDELDEYAVG